MGGSCAMGPEHLRANRQLRYASPAIPAVELIVGRGKVLPMSPDTFVTYLPGRSV